MAVSQLDWYLQINLKARQLRLLVALDDFGNLKQVADISHVTVPAVSKALSELEKGLGLQLFIAECGKRRLVSGDQINCLAERFDVAIVRRSKKGLGDGTEHS